MKLREFVVNSLPRVRGRKKKGQSGREGKTTASITAAVAAAAVATSTTSARSAFATTATSPDDNLSPASQRKRSTRRDGNGNGNWFSSSFSSESRFAFFEKLIGKDSPAKRLLETNKERRSNSVSESGKSERRFEEDFDHHQQQRRSCSSSSKFCPSSSTEPSSPYNRGGGGVQSPPLGERPVFHSQHASPVSVSWGTRDHYSDWDCSGIYSSGYGYGCGYPESLTSFDSTPGSQRGPRSRSRIRTNPWLPSPRPSPYSARSLSSPCASSRSPSPSSPSPVPPSSSESPSPLTSFSSDVNSEAQLLQSGRHHHRRHRRHHSEVKASEFERRFVFDPSLTDTEQYYSTLDSGIGGDTAISSSKDQDKQRLASAKKHRNHNSKKKTLERVPDLIQNIPLSSSPKSKPRIRTKQRSSRSSLPSSNGLIANRDSKYWDSDSSGRSPPPRTSRSLGNSNDRLYFENVCSENCGVFNSRCSNLPGTPREVPGFFPWDFAYEPRCGEFCPVSNPCLQPPSSSLLLSPSDDICIITSNIEKLAHNISSEYEEAPDVTLNPKLDNSKQNQSSLHDLYNLDAEAALISQRLQSELCGSGLLDYNSFAEPLQNNRDLGNTEEDVDEDGRESIISARESSVSTTTTPQQDITPDEEEEDTSTVDVAVQTDFAEDDDEDISGSDWLASTESGSDWPVSGGSDWPTGEEGSGCVTEEEEEEEEGEKEEESTVWVEEGSRLWFVPDIMHNSTDTGYSSLSRDGRITTDDNNNNNNNNNTNNNNNVVVNSPGDDSSDSSSSAVTTTATTTTTTTDERMSSKASDSELSKSDSPSTPSKSDSIIMPSSGAIPKSSSAQEKHSFAPHTAGEMGESCGGDSNSTRRISCKLEFSIPSGNCLCPRNIDPFRNEKALLCLKLNDSTDHSDFSVANNDKPGEMRPIVPRESAAAQGERPGNSHGYNHVVPYPYDVRRFSDVILPDDADREGSVSPCCFLNDGLPSARADEAEREGEFSLDELKQLALLTSTPRPMRDQPEEDFSREPSTSGHHDVTGYDVTGETASPSSSGFPGHFEAPRPGSDLLLPASMRVLRRSLCEDPPSTGRPLEEVKASLEDKVQLLRHGKRLVGRKIREAREEEMVRQQQKLRFQRLLDIHRKRILLDTLQDLRVRLESQSARLQASYSAVLNLQKRCT